MPALEAILSAHCPIFFSEFIRVNGFGQVFVHTHIDKFSRSPFIALAVAAMIVLSLYFRCSAFNSIDRFIAIRNRHLDIHYLEIVLYTMRIQGLLVIIGHIRRVADFTQMEELIRGLWLMHNDFRKGLS